MFCGERATVPWKFPSAIKKVFSLKLVSIPSLNVVSIELSTLTRDTEQVKRMLVLKEVSVVANMNIHRTDCNRA